ncbi:52 kDa repressor of the inhibitor of the protein kinase-like [Aphis craccivora]|uniref:52 kDa repressor of the inhibitor of the protein kinase-like n=1 Tax=Aphis craccivora TaxID=307492 RepID=A0A6G0X0C1_APHCR|nr:52 kDa repressor of the inhibitor of the protein kinase-like [Aphis craccivora]
MNTNISKCNNNIENLDKKLTGLAILHIHRQIELNVETIIDRLAKKKRCRDFYYDDFDTNYLYRSSFKFQKMIKIKLNTVSESHVIIT